jgi:hypothetical protein
MAREALRVRRDAPVPVRRNPAGPLRRCARPLGQLADVFTARADANNDTSAPAAGSFRSSVRKCRSSAACWRRLRRGPGPPCERAAAGLLIGQRLIDKGRPAGMLPSGFPGRRRSIRHCGSFREPPFLRLIVRPTSLTQPVGHAHSYACHVAFLWVVMCGEWACCLRCSGSAALPAS